MPMDFTESLGEQIMTENKQEPVTEPESLQRALNRIREAQRIFATFSQEQVDRIFFAAALAAEKNILSTCFWLNAAKTFWASRMRLSALCRLSGSVTGSCFSAITNTPNDPFIILSIILLINRTIVHH